MHALILFGFLLGVIVGSFLNVIILRYKTNISFSHNRSYCLSCRHTLSWVELIPLFSYIYQRGRCRFCSASISLQYPIVEILTGVLFAAIVSQSGLGLAMLFDMVMTSLLIIIAVYDVRHKIIPNAFVYTFTAVALLSLWQKAWVAGLSMPPLVDLFAGPLLFLPFFALWFFSRGTWMGLGDGKLALGIGWGLGLQGGASAIVLAFWIGAIAGLWILFYTRYMRTRRLSLFSKAYTMKSEIPFGPFLILGFFLVKFFSLTFFDILSELPW